MYAGACYGDSDNRLQISAMESHLEYLQATNCCERLSSQRRQHGKCVYTEH